MASSLNPLVLSIAIPTKNRQSFLQNILVSLLESERQDFEIVINDNSDTTELDDFVRELGDSRVRYVHVSEWLSVVDNCDAAVSACRGDFVCLLGDDDGVLLDESLELLSAARADGMDALMSDVMLYTWPDVTHKFISGIGGKLRLEPLIRRRDKDLVDEAGKLRRVISRGGALGLEGLPCVYQGFIRREVLDKVRGLTGSYFPGPSPDMANAIAIGPFIKASRHVAKPLVISGHSRASGAGRGTMKEHRGAIASQVHLPRDTGDTWLPQIPFFWSGPTIYAQSLHRALARTRITDFGAPGDACLYAACMIFESGYGSEIRSAMKASRHSLLSLVPAMAWYGLLITFLRGIQLVRNMRGRFFPEGATRDAATMAEAVQILRSDL